jgi:predicted nucleic acid-binding protein
LILYLDTSSLVKLYVEEPGSADVERKVGQADFVTTSVVAYAEARAALARRRRERSLTPRQHRDAKAALDDDWQRVLSLELTDRLCRAAGEIAERHRLRGFDAVHLGSYLQIADEFPTESVSFDSADAALNRAARAASRRRAKR